MSRFERSHLLVVVLLLVIADNTAMFRVALGPVLGSRTSGLVVMLAWLWFALILSTIAALLWRPRQAIIPLVVLVLFSTIALSISLVPFVMEIVPLSLSPYVMIAVNAAFLISSIVLLRRGDATKVRVAPA